MVNSTAFSRRPQADRIARFESLVDLVGVAGHKHGSRYGVADEPFPWACDAGNVQIWRHRSGEYARLDWNTQALPEDYRWAVKFGLADIRHHIEALDGFLRPGCRRITLDDEESTNPRNGSALRILGRRKVGDYVSTYHLGYVPDGLADVIVSNGLLPKLHVFIERYQEKLGQVDLFFRVAALQENGIEPNLTVVLRTRA